MRRFLESSRYLILLAVVGTFVMSAALQVGGLLRVVKVIVTLVDEASKGADVYRSLIVDGVGVIDIFLLGTVLFIVSTGLYQLFVDPKAAFPGWLNIQTLDELKVKLIGVIVVALLVAFLGYAFEWTGGTDILAVGLAIAAVVVAAVLAVRALEKPS
jgi:uncharacterized membrane protein YqhA